MPKQKMTSVDVQQYEEWKKKPGNENGSRRKFMRLRTGALQKFRLKTKVFVPRTALLADYFNGY